MKLKFIALRGLSGSGKSHKAKELAAKMGNTKIITKDDIREEMGVVVGKEETRVKEARVVEKRNELIMEALEKGMNIISADTNFKHKYADHIANMRALVFPKYQNEYDFEIVDLTDVPIEVCIERCSNRPEGKEFWRKVIMRQKDEWLTPPIIVQDESLPKCIISDHDGTIAHMCPHRSPYSGVGSENDTKNEIVCEYLMFAKMAGYKIFILSGLEDNYRTHRENWYIANGVEYDELHMRKQGDHRKDWIIKEEIFKEHIEGKYFVHAILDDRPQMLRFWIDKGYSQRLLSIGNPYKEF